jgi:hypothetical protein
VRKKLFLLMYLILLIRCGGPHTERLRSIAEIQRLVANKTADEVQRLLGTPDLREPVLDDEERWIWWNHAVLEGREYAPELRGQVVHLEITFQLRRLTVRSAPAPLAEWRVEGPFAVSYSRPAAKL